MSQSEAQSQLERFRKLLDGASLSKSSAIYPAVVRFLRYYQGKMEDEIRREIVYRVKETFHLSEDELIYDIAGKSPEGRLSSKDPAEIEKEGLKFVPSGLIKDYINYTLGVEGPLPYHLFSILTVMGATLGRRVLLDMDAFKIYPTMASVLVGESGLRKTTASDIAVNLLRDMELVKVYAEKLTPEFLVEEMKDFAQGLIYAPEMVILLNRKKYMEGTVELITRLLDNPDKWDTGTITRKKTMLTDVAISTLYCSTPSWLISGVSEDVFTGGFMARHILVVQHDSSRCFSKPTTGGPKLREKILIELASLYSTKGVMKMTSECDKFYDQWYRTLKDKLRNEEQEIVKTYMQRKHVHVIKVAMNYHLTLHKNLELCVQCFKLATQLLDWNEQFMPPLLRSLFKTAEGSDQAFILRLIQSSGGIIEHTELIRRAEYKMNANRVKALISSLCEGKRVSEVRNGFFHMYLLSEEHTL